MNYKDISVVVQGPIYGKSDEPYEKRFTYQVCKSIRKVLPGAEIIVSTWDYCDIKGLDYDILVMVSSSEDPGGLGANFNRQQITTLKGIEKATRKYVLKLRSESILVNTNFIEAWEKYASATTGNYHFLKKRLVVDGIQPGWSGGIFHMSDHAFFGIKEDVIDLWSVKPVGAKDYFGEGDKLHISMDPHRWLTLSFVKKYLDIDLYIPREITRKKRRLWEEIVANNFISMYPYEYGTYSLKYYPTQKCKQSISGLCDNYSYAQWQRLYKKWCVKVSSLNCKEFIVMQFWGKILWIKFKLKRILRWKVRE